MPSAVVYCKQKRNIPPLESVLTGMETIWKDIQYGARMLFKNPGFTAVAVLSLALGIGVNSTIFSLVNAILLKPMPVAEPGQLVEVYSGVEQFKYSVNSYADYVDLRDENDVFSGLAAHSMIGVTYTHEGQSELVLGEIVTGNYFQVLGVEPVLGRSFLPEEDRTEGTHRVAVVSHGFWQRRFGGDTSLVGKEIRINGKVYNVIGIAPESFTGTLPGFAPELWVPTMMAEEVDSMGMQDVDNSPTGDTRLEKRGTRWLFVKGRLKPGVTREQAEAQLRTIMARLEKEYPESNEERTVNLLPASAVRLHPMLDEQLTPAAILILAVVGLVLLIACANVANMLLSRASARKQEIAIRLAIGAGRARLLRQLLTESLLLSALGGIFGLVLAQWTSGLILMLRPPSPIPIELDLGLDSRVFLFTLGISILAGLVFGLAPALRASRPDLVPALKNEARFEGGERRFNLKNVLVIGQVAVSMILLIGAALLVRSLQSARTTDVGFELERLAVVAIDLGLHDYSDERSKVFYRSMQERLEALPQVDSVTLTQRLPVTVEISMTGVFIDGHQQSPDDDAFILDYTRVGPNYFRTLGIPLIEGRDFNTADAEGPPVAIINETMARTYWPDQNPVGQRYHTDSLDGPTVEIVGVCRDYDVRTVGDKRPYLHQALNQQEFTRASVVVRTPGDPSTMVGRLRKELLAMEPNLIFLEANPMTKIIEVTLLPVSLGAVLIGTFGVLGMILAAVGLYGVIAYSVARRSHEIGLRMALGAETKEVLKMVIKQGMVIAAIGVALGLLGGAAVSRVLSVALYGVNPIDPWSFGAAAILLLSVALLANYIPAKRATRIDPIIALRYE
jgi:predicted permease